MALLNQPVIPIAAVRAAMSTRSMRLVGGRDEFTGRHFFLLLVGC